MSKTAYRVTAASTAAAISVLALTACSSASSKNPGSSTPSPRATHSIQTLDTAFITRANAVCIPYKKWNDNNPNGVPIAGFSVDNPQPRQLAQAADWFDKVPLYHTFSPAFVALGEPKTAGKKWTTIIAQVEQLQQDWTIQIEAARRADTSTWKQQYEKEGPLTSQIADALIGSGFQLGQPCPAIFGY